MNVINCQRFAGVSEPQGTVLGKRDNKTVSILFISRVWLIPILRISQSMGAENFYKTNKIWKYLLNILSEIIN